MKTDIKETENSYVLDIEVPGFDKKDVNVSLENGYLTVSAQKKTCDNGEGDEKIKRKRIISEERGVAPYRGVTTSATSTKKQSKRNTKTAF